MKKEPLYRQNKLIINHYAYGACSRPIMSAPSSSSAHNMSESANSGRLKMNI